MDNLLAAKQVVPMLVVMENGYASRAGETRQPAADPSQPAAFEDLMIQDLIPMIDARYRTRTDRESRAIAGLSMGANQALVIGLGHLDKFAYIGDFSGGFPARDFKQETSNRGVFMKPEMLNSQLKVFFCRHWYRGTLLSIPETVPREAERDRGEARVFRIPWHVA